MTERGRDALDRQAEMLRIGPSQVSWEDGALVIAIDEIAVPLPRRVRGTIRVTPEIMPATAFALEPAGRHLWQPIAPRARVVAAFEAPHLSWAGGGYLDANAGSEPLENGFAAWTWTRAHTPDGAAVLYDAETSHGTPTSLALRFQSGGSVHAFEPPPWTALPGTLWRVPRTIRSEASPAVRATLEDAPFYARSVAEITLAGARVDAFHESLSLGRFSRPWVKALLPFRMPRRS